MNESTITIILLALVAGFLVLRLRSVLGQRTGEERDPLAKPHDGARNTGNVIDLDKPALALDQNVLVEGSAAGALTRIQLADRTFTPAGFLEGAKSAFSMVLAAFAKGDRETLRQLLSADVLSNFEAAINAREQAGETLSTELVDFRKVGIDNAEIENNVALVTVRFLTDQVNIVRNQAAEVIEGDPNQIETITDVWTFRRDVTAADPNWELAATRSLND